MASHIFNKIFCNNPTFSKAFYSKTSTTAAVFNKTSNDLKSNLLSLCNRLKSESNLFPTIGTINYAQSRYYSSTGCGKKNNKKRCPPPCAPRKCQKLVMPGCQPPQTIYCDRPHFQPCKKVNAPYPAYSEFCHTNLDRHPSECRMCPWKPHDHPTYKITKRKYHTGSIRNTNFQKWQEENEKNELNNNNGLVRYFDGTSWKSVERSHSDMLTFLQNIDSKKFEDCKTKMNKDRSVINIKEKYSELNKDKILVNNADDSSWIDPSHSAMLSFLKHADSKKLTKEYSCKDTVKKNPAHGHEKCGKREDDDPCKMRKEGTVQECPTDLLVKKRRKPKKPVQKE